MGEEFKVVLEDYGITETQLNLLFDCFDKFRGKLREGETVTSGSYEQKFYQITDVQRGDYHAAERFLFECAKGGQYEDLYVRFYKGMAKHDARIEQYGFQE